jgi:hypothetical protein
MMAKRPEERPASAAEVAAALEPFANGVTSACPLRIEEKQE